MSNKLVTRFGQSVLIVALHLPLLAYVFSLRDDLAADQGVAGLPLPSLGLLLLFLVLPYAVLAMLGLRWNPPRARLGEPDA
jgi:hypothetical protein